VKLETKGGFLFLDWLLYNDYGLGSACLWYQLSWLGGYHTSDWIGLTWLQYNTSYLVALAMAEWLWLSGLAIGFWLGCG
jgi:hypothetical protein